MDAAPLPEPAFPARSRIPATTGAPSAVEIVVAKGDSPRPGLPQMMGTREPENGS